MKFNPLWLQEVGSSCWHSTSVTSSLEGSSSEPWSILRIVTWNLKNSTNGQEFPIKLWNSKASVHGFVFFFIFFYKSAHTPGKVYKITITETLNEKQLETLGRILKMTDQIEEMELADIYPRPPQKKVRLADALDSEMNAHDRLLLEAFYKDGGGNSTEDEIELEPNCDKWSYYNSFVFSFTAVTTIGIIFLTLCSFFPVYTYPNQMRIFLKIRLPILRILNFMRNYG